MTFILAACLLLVIVLAVLFWAALHKPHEVDNNDLTGRLRGELSEDVSAGLLDADELPAAATDIDVEPRPDNAAARAGKQRGWWILIVLVVVAGVGLYWQTGNWRAAIYGNRAAVMQRAETMLAQLQQHLVEHPDDKQGWITLGRAKSAMGKYNAAATAYGHAVTLDGGRSPELMARWGEAMILADPDNLTQQEHRIFTAVLKAAPNSVRGLWYGGLIALDAGDRTLAIVRWQRLLKQDIPAPMASFVHSRLAALGVTGKSEQPAADEPAPKLLLTIKLGPQLASQLHQDEVLFVYARALSSGPPLAARRVSAGHFPLRVILANHDAMLANRNLSTMLGQKIEVGVFLSKSGKVKFDSKDPRTLKVITLRAGTNPVTLTLKSVTKKQ